MATQENAHMGLSFKEKLLGWNLKDLGEEYDELASDDGEEEDSKEEIETDCPIIRLSEEKVRIRRPW